MRKPAYGFPVIKAMQAEIDRLRAELAERDHAIRDMRATLGMVSERRDSAEARLAAVIDVVRGYERDNSYMGAQIYMPRIRAAATEDTK